MSSDSPSFKSPLGICVLPPPNRNLTQTVTCARYVFEILDHAGLCYTEVDWSSIRSSFPGLKILVTIGEMKPDEADAAALEQWVDSGGGWISVGGTCGLAGLLGVEAEKPAFIGWGVAFSNLGECYLKPVKRKHPTLSHLEIPLHCFNGVPVKASGCEVLAGILDKHQRKTDRVGVSIRKQGKGTALFIAADLTGAVVRIQQGVAITQDGVSAPDGSAPVTDNVLKSDDGAVLDWIFDRQPVPGIDGLNAFLQPIADQWKELLLRAIFHLATEHDVQLYILWLYPRNLPAIAHMSHDTDSNEIPKAWLLLKALKEAEIQSTWCTILPGYDAEVTRAVADAGHELAMHYDSMTEGLEFSEQQFSRQFRELVELFGGMKPVANKNHYLRWEGDLEFYDWCIRHGIQLDQSKGASKTGEAGFNFGTCHPFFPISREGKAIDVLELPTPTQDFHVFIPPAIGKPLLAAAMKHHGVMHILFHPAHIDKPNVADSLIEIVRKAKAEGLEWWTAKQINNWERARRTARWDNVIDGTELKAGQDLDQATILVLQTESTRKQKLQVNGANVKSQQATRWGFRFKAITTDIKQGSSYTIATGAK